MKTTRHFTAIVVLSFASPILVAAQTGSKVCPTRVSLKLEQILELISNKVAEEHINGLIESCHVSFALDPAALEKLNAAGVPASVFGALNRDVTVQMSAEGAHAEAAAIESRKKLNEQASNAARDAALRKSDLDYKTKRDQDSYVSARGQFETTAAYEARKQKINNAVAVMDRNHEAERAQIAQKFAGELAQKNALFDKRIGFLTAALYPAGTTTPVFVAYDPDASRLTVSVGGEEYWFNAEPRRAEAMNNRWNTVRILRPYDDDEKRTRFLSESLELEPLRGVPSSLVKQAEAAADAARALQSARAALARGDYKTAREYFERAKQLDPSNVEADSGLAAIESAIKAKQAADAAQEEARQKLAELRRSLVQNPKLYPGTWYDASTDLMWTDRDNGSAVVWPVANNTCRTTATGGFTNWRLPSIAELQTLYGGRPKIRESFGKLMDPNNKTLGIEHYRIRGDIRLSGVQVWSGTMQNSSQAFVASFEVGGQAAFNIGTTSGRVLCARNLDAAPDLRGRPGMPAAPPAQVAPPVFDERTLVLTADSPSAERNAAIVAPRNGFHNYNVYFIDTRQFPGPGVLEIEIQLSAGSATDGSFDLYPENFPVPSRGRPEGSLVGRYDVRKGSTVRLQYRFVRGQKFALAMEGNWFSPIGARGQVQFQARVHR